MTDILPTHKIMLIAEAGRKTLAEQMIDATWRQAGEGPRVRFSTPLAAPNTLVVTHWAAYMWARADRFAGGIAPLLREYVSGVGSTEQISPITHARWHASGVLGGAYAVYYEMPSTPLIDPEAWLTSLGLEIMTPPADADETSTAYQQAVDLAYALKP